MAFATEATPGSSRDDRLFYKGIKRVGLRTELFYKAPVSILHRYCKFNLGNTLVRSRIFNNNV
jgi:hypothetical protein